MESASFTLIDTSQLVHLCEKRRIGQLSSPSFIAKHGFPFLSMHSIIELAGISDVGVFAERMAMLSSVEAFYTLNYSGRQFPGSIADLTTIEIEEVWKQGPSDRVAIRRHVRDRIYPIKLAPSDQDVQTLFRDAKLHTDKSGFLSAFGAGALNPYLSQPVRKLRGLVLNSLDPPGIDSFVADFGKTLGAKGVPDARAEEFIKFFLTQFRSLQAATPHGIAVPEWLGQLAEEELDPDKSMGYYLELYLLKMQLRNSAKTMKVDPALLLGSISIDDIRTIKLSSALKSELDFLLTRDVPRRIETSAMADIHLATYSLFIDTFVDKRTLDLAKRANRQLNYDLALHQVYYKLP